MEKKKIDNRRNCLHERVLRMIHDDSTSSFVSLLEKDNSLTVHGCNIQQLAMEIYKVAHGPASKTTSVLFLRNSNMQTQSQSELLVPQMNTIWFGQNSIRYLGLIIWNSLPLTLRNVDSFSEFNFLIKNWKPTNCHCRLWKNYIPNVGFVNVTH